MALRIRAVGHLAYDETRLADVSLKKGARITLTFDAGGRCRGHTREPAVPKRP
jgi:hypothetical protein